MTFSIGRGRRQARPGLVRTRTGSPNRVTTTAWPGVTITAQALSATAVTTTPARSSRLLPPSQSITRSSLDVRGARGPPMRKISSSIERLPFAKS